MANEEDGFAEFEDWLKDGSVGRWPEIIAANANLLMNSEGWRVKITRFEELISTLDGEGAQKTKRAEFAIRFHDHVFDDGDKDFHNRKFPCSVSFSNADFGEGDVNFRRTEFGEGDVSFSGVKFGRGYVDFRNADFGEGSIDFSNAKFGEGNVNFVTVNFGKGYVDFSSAEFGEGYVLFSSAEFGEGSVIFNNAEFGEGSVSFKRTEFGEGNVSFLNSNFGEGSVSFLQAKFGKGDVDFRSAEFGEGSVDFSRVKFGEGDVDFSNAKFEEGSVNFSSTEFGEGSVNFSNVEFGEGDAFFINVKFWGESVNFSNVGFGKGNVFFTKVEMKFATLTAPDMVVKGNLYIKSAYFKAASFNRLKVAETASFDGTVFETTPDFQDAKFDSPPEVAGMIVFPPKMQRRVPIPIMERYIRPVSLERILTPPTVEKIKWRTFSHASDNEDVAKYRKLKAMALDANDHEKDGEFFAYEMMAKRGVETTSFGGLLFSSAYWSLSNFGQSFKRPLGWMLGSLLVFSYVYLVVLSWNPPPRAIVKPSALVAFSVQHSARSSIPLLNSAFRFSYKPEELVTGYETTYSALAKLKGAGVGTVYFLSIIQSLFGAIFLFMFLLALRNRFRLK